MIKYIGSKRLLVEQIVALVKAMPNVSTVGDFFSGTSRVGHALKLNGYRVVANDHNEYAATLARCYVEADRETHYVAAEKLLKKLSHVEPVRGYVTETFCEKSHYFQAENGMRIDAMRSAIAEMKVPEPLQSVLLVSLMEAADRVDSTTGVQMAYLRNWSARSYNKLELRVPNLAPRAAAGGSKAYNLDALDAADLLECDVAYLDPPYNQHKYLGNYHVWETLVRWDAPEVYGKACKRIDCRTRTSDFNSRPRFRETFASMVKKIRARYLIVSFSDEGYITRDDMQELLGSRGAVGVIANDYKRYVGAQIGVYSPSGEKVGRVSHLRNQEYFFVVAPTARDLKSILDKFVPPVVPAEKKSRVAARARS